MDLGPFGCINYSVIPRGKCLMTHWVIIQSLRSSNSNRLGFPWLFPKIISMGHKSQWGQDTVSMKTKPMYLCYFLSTRGPFLLLLIGSICHWSSWWHDWRLKQPGHFLGKERDLCTWLIGFIFSFLIEKWKCVVKVKIKKLIYFIILFIFIIILRFYSTILINF